MFDFTIELREKNVIILNNFNYYSSFFSVYFNDYKFKLIDLIQVKEVRNYYDEFEEVLPGIYLKVILDNKFNRFFKKLKNLNHLITIKIKVKNMRDYISVRYRDHKSKFYFENKHRKDIEINDSNEFKERYESVDVTEIPSFPNTLGGGAGKCDIWSLFQRKGLLNTFNPFSPLSVSQMLSYTATKKEYLDICRSSKHCGPIIEKLLNNQYRIDYPEGDQIQLGKEDGYYRAYEGKHRICMAKRFNIPYIYAHVSEIIKNGESRKTSSFKDKSHEIAPVFLHEYYKTFQRLGLDRSNITYIIEQGLTGDKLIDYFEKRGVL